MNQENNISTTSGTNKTSDINQSGNTSRENSKKKTGHAATPRRRDVTRRELARRLAASLPQTLNKDSARLVVGALIDAISLAVIRGERVNLRGFGLFYAKTHAPRKARNPRTGQTIHVEARRSPSFHPAPLLRGLVRAIDEPCDKQAAGPEAETSGS